jgi:toxin FitB
MILLDTNVVSEVMRTDGEQCVLDWLDQQPGSSVWITSITLMEIRYGLESMPQGRKREEITESFELFLSKAIEERIAAFDSEAARYAANLMALRKNRGRPGELKDTMIAGIALATRATLATRNTAHFEDLSVPVVNPWTA